MPKGQPQTAAQKAEKEAEKIAKFKKLGTARLNKAITAIRALIPLANKNSYTSTEEQQKLIIEHLDAEAQRVADAFAGTKVSTGGVEL